MKSIIEKALEVVKYESEKRDMPVYRLEDNCGISRGSISKWETIPGESSKFSAMNVSKLLIAFPEISADWMMRDDDKFTMLKRAEAPVNPYDFTARVHESVKDRSEMDALVAENKRLTDEIESLQKRLKTAIEYSSMLQEMLGK